MPGGQDRSGGTGGRRGAEEPAQGQGFPGGLQVEESGFISHRFEFGVLWSVPENGTSRVAKGWGLGVRPWKM